MTPWQPGQSAVINRRERVTIDRVTPAGRAVVGDRTFNPDGYERGSSSLHRAKLEVISPEIEAAMAFMRRAAKAKKAAYDAVDKAERWVRSSFSPWGNKEPSLAEVEQAERLVVAINKAMEVKP